MASPACGTWPSLFSQPRPLAWGCRDLTGSFCPPLRRSLDASCFLHFVSVRHTSKCGCGTEGAGLTIEVTIVLLSLRRSLGFASRTWTCLNQSAVPPRCSKQGSLGSALRTPRKHPPNERLVCSSHGFHRRYTVLAFPCWTDACTRVPPYSKNIMMAVD